MNKFAFVILGILLFPGTLSAQRKHVALRTDSVPRGIRDLDAGEALLRQDVIAAERVIDLVEVMTIDSVVEKPRQRIAGVIGWTMQRLLSRYWQYLDPVKKKYVGTSSRSFKVFDGIQKEVDLNIFLMPHLPHYVSMARKGFDKALERPRGKKQFRTDTPGYPCPEELRFGDRGYFTVECEVTPAEDRRALLSELFLPTEKGPHDLESHPNFGVKYPAFGTYGVWCLDCNHNCRPEIHPIEWLWWMDLSEDRPGGPSARNWMISLMRDGSERFEDWSPGPMVGIVSVPVTFRPGTPHVRATLENLVVDRYREDLAASLILPPEAREMGRDHAADSVTVNGKLTVLGAGSAGAAPDAHIPFWWSDFRYAPEEDLAWGYLNIAIAVDNVYAGRLTVDLE